MIVVASIYIGVKDGDVLVIVAIGFVDVVDCCDLSVSEIDPGAQRIVYGINMFVL